MQSTIDSTHQNATATIPSQLHLYDDEVISWLFPGLLLSVLWLTSRYSYPVFHTLAETFSIMIACGLFALAWNTRRYLHDNYLLLLGGISLCSGFVDMLHMMSYKGVELITGYDNNLPMSLWIAGRSVQSAALFLATLRLSRRTAREDTSSIIPAFLMYSAITSLLIWSVFAGHFPVCWIKETGLTPFKKAGEVVTSALFIGSGVVLWRCRARFNAEVVRLLLAFFVTAACANIAFIYFVDLYGISNLLGHSFKIISYYLLYRAIIKKGLQQPMDLLFHQLQTNNAALKKEIEERRNAQDDLEKLNDSLEQRVQERAADLERTNTLLNAIIEAAPAAIIGLDLEGRVQTVWNPAAEKTLGWSAEEVMGRFLPSIPVDQEEEFRQFRQWVQSGKPLNGKEVHRQRRDGSSIDYSIYAAPLHNAEGQISGNVAVLIDITERKRMKDALAAREQEFRALAENAPDPIIRYDRDGRRLYVNPATERISGKRAEAMLGRTPSEGLLISATEGEKIMSWVREVAETGMPTEGEITLLTPDGKARYFYNRYVPEWSKDGTVASVLSISGDITALKQTEKELKSKNAELERFTYTVSHDLKSPLVTIKSFSGAIKNDLASCRFDRIEKDLDRISAATGKMTALLDDLLKLSRAGQVISVPVAVDMARLVDSVLTIMAGLLKEHKVAVSVQPGLPTVMCDRQRITEVLQNLVENGIKYRGNQPEPRIEIGLREENGGQIFFVQDNGPGIEPRYHENIFGLFNRLNTQLPGTGIGLALVKRIIEMHGGSIWVESDGQGNGSTFCFTLG